MRFIHKTGPLKVLNNHLNVYPTPMNLSYAYNFGSLAGIVLASQIITGILLAMHYVGHVDLAFNSVVHLMNDVPSGMILRYAHANGASLFFIVVYIHILRGVYYSSGNQPREAVWITGVVILLVMVLTAFIGYVLPWGQMSFWGVCVCPTCTIISDSLNNSLYILYNYFMYCLVQDNTVLLAAIITNSQLMQRTRNKKAGKLNANIYSVIIGSLLGDAFAERRTNTRVCFQQEDSAPCAAAKARGSVRGPER